MNRAAAGGALYGAALVLRPRQALSLTGSDPDLPGAEITARVLGARHLLQAALQWSGRVTPGWALLIDGTHAASMLALAAVAPEYRRAALTSAGAATVLALTARTSAGPARTF